MDILKYIIAAGVAFVFSLIVWIMGNFLSGVLLFILLFGGYLVWNVFQNVKNEPPVQKEKEDFPQDN
jgi:hypothetical protein